jgi:uncharacterized protein with PQ loop repeat
MGFTTVSTSGVTVVSDGIKTLLSELPQAVKTISVKNSDSVIQHLFLRKQSPLS